MDVVTADPNNWMGGSMEDQFMKLPDDILVAIVSRLKLREAAATSVLSCRWKNIWHHLTTLDFVDTDLLPYGKTLTLSSWVNNVVNLHQRSTTKLDEFKVSFGYFGIVDADFASISSWIQFALERRVKRLWLDLRVAKQQQSNYVLKTSILLNYDLHSLKVLTLCSVDVGVEVLDYVFSSCPFLEVLHVEDSQSLVELTVPGSLQKLKCLEIISCSHMMYLEVRAVNIVSFSYHGPTIGLVFDGTPSTITEASFGGSYSQLLLANSSKLPIFMNQLKFLALDYRCLIPISARPKDLKFPELTKLEQLELRLSGIIHGDCQQLSTKLLKSSPLRYKFVMHPIEDLEVPKFKTLKQLELSIFEDLMQYFSKYKYFKRGRKIALNIHAKALLDFLGGVVFLAQSLRKIIIVPANWKGEGLVLWRRESDNMRTT